MSSVILYRQLVPSAAGIKGAASIFAVAMNRNIDNVVRCGAPSGRALPKLWNLRNLRPHMSRKYCTSLSMLAVVFSLHATGFPADPPKSERRVVIVVWDGMRPDFVSERNTPALWKLARGGVIFRNHHAVYPSATMVNGTALVTGIYPGKNGIIANHVYRPEIDPHHAVDVELPPTVKKGDELSDGKYIAVPTIADLVERAGARSVIAAAKTVGLLLDRQFSVGALRAHDGIPSDGKRKTAAALNNRVTLFTGQCLPSAALDPITEKLGPFPSAHLQKDSWTTKALI